MKIVPFYRDHPPKGKFAVVGRQGRRQDRRPAAVVPVAGREPLAIARNANPRAEVGRRAGQPPSPATEAILSRFQGNPEAMTTNLCSLTISEAAKLIAAKEISPVELAEALLRRIEAVDPQLHAFVTVTADLAIDQARMAAAEIAAGRHRGPMHRIPFGLNDIYNTVGILTPAGSRILADNFPKENATARLRAVGALPLGKLSTHEFAHGEPATRRSRAPVSDGTSGNTP